MDTEGRLDAEGRMTVTTRDTNGDGQHLYRVKEFERRALAPKWVISSTFSPGGSSLGRRAVIAWQDGQLPPEPDWSSDLRMTYAGIPEVGPQWLMEHRSAVTLLDVREPGEWQNEPLPAQLDSVVQIPIGSLADRVAEVPQGKPVVALCRSGKRSSLATGILRGAGFEQVASLHGGVLPLAQH